MSLKKPIRLIMSLKSKLNSYKTLIESIFSLSILKSLNILLPLVTLPYLLRVVGAANYGVYSFIFVLIQYLLLITSYGFNYSATKQISLNRNNQGVVNKVFNSVFACRFILLLLGLIIFFLLSPILLRSKDEKSMFIMGLGIVIGDILNPVWLFQGTEKMRYMTIVNLFSKLVFTILIFVFIREASDYLEIILFNSLGSILSGVLSIFIARHQFKIHFQLPTWEEIKIQFREGFTLFCSTIGINLYDNSNIFILKFFVDDSLIGIYSAAEKIIKGLKLLGSPISQALFPHLGNNFKNKTNKESLLQLFKAGLLFSIFLLIISLGTFIFADLLIRIFGGTQYIEGIKIIRIMCITILLGGLNSLLGFSGLVNLNRQKDFMIGVFISGIFCIIFQIIFIPVGGIIIAAWASVLSEVILLTVILVSLYKINKRQ